MVVGYQDMVCSRLYSRRQLLLLAEGFTECIAQGVSPESLSVLPRLPERRIMMGIRVLRSLVGYEERTRKSRLLQYLLGMVAFNEIVLFAAVAKVSTT